MINDADQAITTLRGKTALITGGGRGIGRAISLQLAREGCDIAISGRNELALTEVASQAREFGVSAYPLISDFEQAGSVTNLHQEAINALGTIDFLVNNAAVLNPSPLIDASLATWERTMKVNLTSSFQLSQLSLKTMIARRTGYIVNISSTVAHGVKSEVAAYGASKCGLAGLTEALWAAGKPYGVKASTVYPGVTDTPMVRGLSRDDSVGTPDDWMLPEDIAYCVLFLLKQSHRMIVKEITPWAVGYDRI